MCIHLTRYYFYKNYLKEKRAYMDAPISITLAHVIIIWTLLLFLVAWMLTFAILALRPAHSSEPDAQVVKYREQESMSRVSTSTTHAPRAVVLQGEFVPLQTQKSTDSRSDIPVITTI
jgi:hypothetical protein